MVSPLDAAAPAAGAAVRSRLFPAFPVAARAALIAFAVLFFDTFRDLLGQWWSNPDAGQGLLLAPVCVWLAYRSGVGPTSGRPRIGTTLLVLAVILRLAGTLGGEYFTMRVSLIVAMAGLVVYWRGLPQLRRWWLPFVVGALAIPLPAVLLNTLAIPLQLLASKIGSALISWRDIPFQLNGNVIDIPGHRLFVAEACSGLRSLTALLSLGVLIGGMFLGKGWSRIALICLTIPIAVFLNGARIFLTAFLIYFVDPSFGKGFMHLSEGWLIFVVAFGAVGIVGMLLRAIELRFSPEESDA